MNNNSQPFSSWPIPQALKLLLSWKEKWTETFLMESKTVALILQTLSEEIKEVNYFSSLADTQQFFEFLKKLIECKPQDSQVLKAINHINSDIFEKISLKKSFNSHEAKLVVDYLSLLNFLLVTDHCYLFSRSEISIRSRHFLVLSKIRFKSTDLLTQFHHTLLASFECKKFLQKDPMILPDVIANLAKSIKKQRVENNERAAMQLFYTLGALTKRLKTSQDLRLNPADLELFIKQKIRFVYRRFKPFVETKLLKYSCYKFFLTQAYKSTGNVSQLCKSSAYRRQCITKYSRFVNNFYCVPGQFPHFMIIIKNNNLFQTELDTVCTTLRSAESFFVWMEKNCDLRSNYKNSQYTLHLAASEKDFLIDKFLYEQDDPLKKTQFVQANYFQSKKSIQTDNLVGASYTYNTSSSKLVHDYIHHLTALFINNRELNLILNKSLAELNLAGICLEKQIHSPRNFINDTFIFEFLEVCKFPFYFYALKWGAYLVNEHPELFKKFMNFFQEKTTESFYTSSNAFISNDCNKQEFVTWADQHVNICANYLSRFPNGHQPPILYLKDVSAHWNRVQPMGLSNSMIEEDLLSQVTKLALSELLEKTNSSYETQAIHKQIWQESQESIPLQLAALFAGVTSAFLDDIGLLYKKNYPSLPAYLNNGFKPFVFAAMSAGLNTIFFDKAVVEVEQKFARFFVYFVMNYIGVAFGQPLNKKLSETFQNRILNFFVQMMTWTLLWNPSLFLLRGSQLFSTLFLQVMMQALSFKVGEETYQIGKRVCSPFWTRQRSQAFNLEAKFLNSENDEELFASNNNLRVT